jgi:hypothetical protein
MVNLKTNSCSLEECLTETLSLLENATFLISTYEANNIENLKKIINSTIGFYGEKLQLLQFIQYECKVCRYPVIYCYNKFYINLDDLKNIKVNFSKALKSFFNNYF